MLEAFEDAFARYTGTKYAVGVSSCTTGLHAAVATAGIGPSDQVVTSAFSFVASSNCILYENADPVFVDIDPDTFNLDPAGIESALTDRTRSPIARARCCRSMCSGKSATWNPCCASPATAIWS